MSERNKAAVREQGGIADLVEALRLHPDHAGLQKEACGALGSMARLSEKNKEAIARASAIPFVIAAMRAHPAALEQACWAIRNLAGIGLCCQICVFVCLGPMRLGAGAREPWCFLSLSVRCWCRVCISLQCGSQNRRNSGLTPYSCSSLTRLFLNVAANNGGNKLAIAEAGGIESLVEALRSAEAPAVVAEQACAALGNLATVAANRQAISVRVHGV